MPKVVEVAKKLGIEKLSAVQKEAIAAILAGRDVLVVAPTGYGKTEAAIIPVLSELKKRAENGDSWGIQAVYVTPLRALNRDILLRLERWCGELGIRLAVRHGDTKQSERQKQRDEPPQFLITTPETLDAVLVAPKLSDALQATRVVIVDEYHELLEGKRGLQLGLTLARISKKSAYPVQLVALSATIGDVSSAAKTLSKKAVAVESRDGRELNLSADFIERKTVGQADEKSDALAQKIAQLIESHKKTLVFTNTRSNAEWVGSRLHRMPSLEGKIAVHHSSLSAVARKEAEDAFKHPEGLRAIVCTSSLELGIDVGDVDLVVQVVSPRQVSRLVQRVGRSGHRTHLVPKGICLSYDALDCAESATVCLLAQEGKLERNRMSRPALDSLAHEIVGCLLDKSPQATLGQVRDILSKSPAYEAVGIETYFDIALELSRKRVLSLLLKENLPEAQKEMREAMEKLEIRRMPATLLFYYENLSAIDDKKALFVRNASSNKAMGVLDEEFAAQYLGVGATFISRGRPWRVLSITDDDIAVEESSDYSAAIPEWRGEEIPVTPQVAAGVCDLLAFASREDGEAVCKKYPATRRAAQEICKLATAQAEAFRATPSELFAENLPNGRVALHCFLGDKFNEALSMVTCELLHSGKTRVRPRPGQYGTIFEFDSLEWDAERLEKLLAGLTVETFAYTLEQSIPASSLMRARFAHAARRFNLISRRFAIGNRGAFLRSLVSRARASPAYKEARDEILYDKLNLDECRRLFSSACNAGGRLRVVVANPQKISPLAKSMLDSAAFHDAGTASVEPDEKALEEFTKTLLEKNEEMLCTFCGRQFSVPLSSDWNSKISCPQCGSSQVATAEYLQTYRELQKKMAAAKTGEEKAPAKRRRRPRGAVLAEVEEPTHAQNKYGRRSRTVAEMHAVASLISSYGMRAAIALSVFGVGPETAGRVLSRMHKSEGEFHYDLLSAQKNFIRTKGYWKR